MAGVQNIAAWRALQAELVLPRQLPDGVLSVLEHGQTEPDIYILEIATYPDARVPSQAVRDAVPSLLERNVLPEVIVLFLHEKGNVPAADSVELRSRKGFTNLKLSWRAVKLWELPAEELLAAGDAALLPWVPLAKFSGPPETIVSRCRARIDSETSSPDREDLLTVAQFLLKLRYDEEPLLTRLKDLLGGREAMIHSPLYQEIVEEAKSERDAASHPRHPRGSLRSRGEGPGASVKGPQLRQAAGTHQVSREVPQPRIVPEAAPVLMSGEVMGSCSDRLCTSEIVEEASCKGEIKAIAKGHPEVLPRSSIRTGCQGPGVELKAIEFDRLDRPGRICSEVP